MSLIIRHALYPQAASAPVASAFDPAHPLSPSSTIRLLRTDRVRHAFPLQTPNQNPIGKKREAISYIQLLQHPVHDFLVNTIL